MMTAEQAVYRLKEAESKSWVSPSASANIHRWLTEAPFARFRARLLEEIEEGRWNELDEAFYTVLEFGTGGRRGKMYPVGTNVLNERTIAESAGPRRLCDRLQRRRFTPIMRDRT